MFKVELIEAANARQQHAILKLLHVATGLQHDGGISRAAILFQVRQRFRVDKSLRKVFEFDRRLRLLPPRWRASGTEDSTATETWQTGPALAITCMSMSMSGGGCDGSRVCS